MAGYYTQFGNPDQSLQLQRAQQPQPGFAGGMQYSPFDSPGQPISYMQPISEMPVAPPSGYPSESGYPPSGYQPDRYPRRQPRIPRNSDSPLSRPKKKSTTRKLVEGGLAAGLGIAASSYLKSRHTGTQTSSAAEDQHGPTGGRSRGHRRGSLHGISSGGPIVNKVLEGALLTAEGVGLAHLRKSKHRASGRDRSQSGSDSEETDPRLRRLLEGALATAGAVAVAYHDKKKRPKRESRHSRD